MLVQGIKSRPTYAGLVADAFAKHHIFVADGEGAQAILDLYARSKNEIGGRTIFVYAATSHAGGQDYVAALEALQPDAFHELPTIVTAMARLSGILAGARMGTRIYAAGSETMIGLVVQAAQASGMDAQAVMTEHRGTTARRVQCVHCKGFSENVTTNIVQCVHCGEHLLVRDHYSRRYAAFMGVSADAEAPGELPEIVETFK